MSGVYQVLNIEKKILLSKFIVMLYVKLKTSLPIEATNKFDEKISRFSPTFWLAHVKICVYNNIFFLEI